MKRIHYLVLGVIVLASFLAAFWNHSSVPMCLNADEVAFSYNAFSIAHTGKDEYGTTLPLRLKSYGDYKLPLITYLTVPIVAIAGLNIDTARALNSILAILFPLVLFGFAQTLLGRKTWASLGIAGLAATSLGFAIVSRHQHEAYLATLLVVASLWCYLRALEKPNFARIATLALLILLSMFSYHFARIFAVFIAAHAFFVWLPKRDRQTGLILASVIAVGVLFGVSDVFMSPARVKNLVFFNSPGYVMRVQQLREEGGSRFLYNKLVPGVKDVAVNTLSYYSPQFLLLNGDENPRFGFPGMGLVTLPEYLLFFAGLFYVFKHREKYRWFLIALLFVSPLGASLSWAGQSLTRSLVSLVPFYILAGYGGFQLLSALSDSIKKSTVPMVSRLTTRQIKSLGITLLLVINSWFLYYNWDFYLNHYPKRALVIRGWGCGYQQLADYLKPKLDKYDTVYLTKENGQPYMFMLFMLAYPPAEYQKQAKLSALDEYGFGTVEEFGKFKFRFQKPKPGENALLVGTPDDFKANTKDYPDIEAVKTGAKVIKLGNEEIFWIVER